MSLYEICPDDELLISDNWLDTAKKLKVYACENGISFVQSHGPNVNPLKSDDDFEKSVRLTERAVEICGFLGIPNMVVHPGYDPKISKKEWFEKNYVFFSALFPSMEKFNVNILHENTCKSNMPWYFSKTGKEMREFSEFVGHPKFHSCWDTGHGNNEGAQYNEILDIGDDLFAVHINDNGGQYDQHLIPYFGTTNMDEIMNALIDIGYKGVFTFESSSSVLLKNCRRSFDKDKRLANPPVCFQEELEKLMYHIGEYILKSYDLYE